MGVFLTLAVVALLLVVIGALLHAVWWLLVLGIVVFLVDLAFNHKLLGSSRRRSVR